MKIRIKFSKKGLMQYIGHLDFMRAWQKIFRQSGIPIAYSEGFNPHQVFSIAAPLAVGVTSQGEYLDLKLKVEQYDLDLLVKQVNEVCPDGVHVIEAAELVGKQTAGMAACAGATYVIDFSTELYQDILTLPSLDEFLAQDQIIVQKKNKKGKINDLDLKPGIYEYNLSEQELTITLATGSSLNIKPDLLLDGYFKWAGYDYLMSTNHYYDIHRLDIYTLMEPRMNLIEILKG